MQTIAIIGASFGQKAIYEKAHEIGMRTVGFAWPKGAICRDLADVFYPVSITEIDQIVELCRQESVRGVVTSGSELTALVAAQIAEQLELPGNSPDVIRHIQNKSWVREQTNDIEGLKSVEFSVYSGKVPKHFPCVVKPVTGVSKLGVCFANNAEEFSSAVSYASNVSPDIQVEELLVGREISVESISYGGKHCVVQITDKVTTGAPHFVELAHHQPTSLPIEVKNRIRDIVPKILDRVGYQSGASHIEMKVDDAGRIGLIEINPRGGGDEIANTLVGLSTNCDYVRLMIESALGMLTTVAVEDVACAGIYFICAQTSRLLPIYKDAERQSWFVKKEELCPLTDLKTATGNIDRNAYFIYCASSRISF